VKVTLRSRLFAFHAAIRSRSSGSIHLDRKRRKRQLEHCRQLDSRGSSGSRS
jgi:hypothetical protein